MCAKKHRAKTEIHFKAKIGTNLKLHIITK